MGTKAAVARGMKTTELTPIKSAQNRILINRLRLLDAPCSGRIDSFPPPPPGSFCALGCQQPEFVPQPQVCVQEKRAAGQEMRSGPRTEYEVIVEPGEQCWEIFPQGIHSDQQGDAHTPREQS